MKQALTIVLVVLVCAAAVGLWIYKKSIVEDVALKQIRDLQAAVNMEFHDNRDAATLDGILGLPRDITTDPWGTQLELTPAYSSTQFSIRSAGPDKQMNTGDDIEGVFDWATPSAP